MHLSDFILLQSDVHLTIIQVLQLQKKLPLRKLKALKEIISIYFFKHGVQKTISIQSSEEKNIEINLILFK